MARWAKPVAFVVVALVTLGVLATWVFPTRTWIEQREALASTGEHLADLRAERAALETRIEELGDPAELEALARRDFGLVKPGEEAYAVLAEPIPEVDLPAVWPFGPLTPPPDEDVEPEA